MIETSVMKELKGQEKLTYLFHLVAILKLKVFIFRAKLFKQLQHFDFLIRQPLKKLSYLLDV